MVAPHVDYQHCCKAARVELDHGNELVSFPCPKCGAVYCDPVEHAMKLQAQHGYMACGPSIHLYRGILWLCWGAKMRDSTLFIQKLPVDSSILGVTDHYSGFVTVLLLLFILVEIMTKLLFHR